MLFLQGTRDALADLKLLRPICAKLSSRATLHSIEGADHSFHVLKSSGKTDEQVLRELAETQHPGQKDSQSDSQKRMF